MYPPELTKSLAELSRSMPFARTGVVGKVLWNEVEGLPAIDVEDDILLNV